MKTQLRTSLKQQYAAADLVAYRDNATQQVANTPALQRAKTIVAYAPLNDEIPYVAPLREQFPDKHWYIIPPTAQWARSLLAHIATLPQPICILVPARALDSAGNRLGRGGGFYDKLLAALGARCHLAPTVSVVPDFAFLDTIPTETYDQLVDIPLKARIIAPLD